MIGALIDRLTGRADQAPPAPDPAPPAGVPPELVAAIEAAHVVKRSAPDPETGDVRIILRIAGLGAFAFQGTGDAAERIARAYPDLPASAVQRAAQLVAAQAARETRFAYHRARAGRRSWVWGWQEFDQ